MAATIAVLLGLIVQASAQPEDVETPVRILKVGVYVSPPFVIKEYDRYTGMAIELWETLASNAGVGIDYREYDTLRNLLRAAATGEIDVIVTNLTITQNRAKTVDFTQPWFDGGMRIMIDEDRRTGFWDLVAGLRNAGFLRSYAWLAFVIVAATVVLTFFDRHFDRDFPSRWREGLAESFFVVMSVATSGRTPARKNLFGWVGRLWSALWLACGIAVLAYVTSSVTSVMTTLSLTSHIAGVNDLSGRLVGVMDGSVGEDFARDAGLTYQTFPHIEDAVAALHDGSIVAVVGDAPVLEYFAHANPQLPLSVVGGIFEPDKYGFALPLNSPFTRPLTLELLGAHESGLVEDLRVKYFGDEQ